MKTAIIYRSNKNLDKNLVGLKEKVELFYAFPKETPEESISKKIIEILDLKEEEHYYTLKFERVICDATCYDAIQLFSKKRSNAKIEVLNQGEEHHQKHIKDVVSEAKKLNKDIVIIKNCLAHHCVVEGVVPYGLENNGKNTWYLDKVLELWIKELSVVGVNFEVFDDDNIMPDNFIGKMVICDSHNKWEDDFIILNEQGKLILRSAFKSLGEEYASLEETQFFFQTQKNKMHN
jgi:hypothetical protein